MRHYISTVLGMLSLVLLLGCGDTKGGLEESMQSLSVKTPRVMRERYSHRDDTSLDKVVFRDYNKQGDVWREKHDYLGDGSVDVIRLFDYDSEGILLREHCDSAYADMLHYTNLSFHDEKGRIVSEIGDIGSDGSVDWVKQYTYDMQGHKRSASIDSDNDGVEDIKINYDEEGNIVREDDGIHVVSYVYAHDEAGRVLTQSRLDEQGMVDRIVTYYWE
jgi:hypothetical protein